MKNDTAVDEMTDRQMLDNILTYAEELTAGSYRHYFNHNTAIDMILAAGFTRSPEADAFVTLAARDAAIKAEALEEAATRLDRQGVVWHGDDGVTIREEETVVARGLPLTSWLRSLAAAPPQGRPE